MFNLKKHYYMLLTRPLLWPVHHSSPCLSLAERMICGRETMRTRKKDKWAHSSWYCKVKYSMHWKQKKKQKNKTKLKGNPLMSLCKKRSCVRIRHCSSFNFPVVIINMDKKQNKAGHTHAMLRCIVEVLQCWYWVNPEYISII